MTPHSHASASPATALSRCEVLIIDGSSHYTSALQQQLSLVKVQRVHAVASATEALQVMHRRHHDVVLCDHSLGREGGGLHLLEAARGQGCLGASTAFVIMVSHPSPRLVAECRDQQVDSLLLRPTTVNVLEDRLRTLLERQAALAGARQMMDTGDPDGALQACDRLIAEAGRWAGHARQLKARALIRAGRAAQAVAFCRDVLAREPGAGWALLALAQAHHAGGDHDEARKAARAVLARLKADQHVDAFDILASSMDAQGDGAAAIKVLHEAVALVPSPGRLRRLGELAYRHRQLQTARQSYERLVRTTRGTLLAHDLDTLSLAQVEVDLDEVGSAMRSADQVLRNVARHSDLAGAASALRAQAFARMRKPREAREAVHQAREAHIEPTPELPTLAMAKAELMAGSEAEGIRLLQGAFAAQPSAKVQQTVDNMLADTGRQHMAARVFEHVRALQTVKACVRAFREDRMDDGLRGIQLALQQFPDNSEVLMASAKLHCMALGVSKRLNPQHAQRATACVQRLQQMLPDNREVQRVARYHGDTLRTLQQGSTTQ